MFHVLWYEHLLSLVIRHHSSILLFPLILCLFISSLFYSYSFHRFSFLYSSSYSTSHFHSFSYQHTLSSLFFYAIPFLSFNPFSPLSHSILPHYSTPLSFIFSFSFSLPLHHLLIILPIHSFPHHPLSFYSHSILHPIPFQRHSPFLFFLSLLHTTLRFDSLLFSSLFPYINIFVIANTINAIHIHKRALPFYLNDTFVYLWRNSLLWYRNSLMISSLPLRAKLLEEFDLDVIMPLHTNCLWGISIPKSRGRT